MVLKPKERGLKVAREATSHIHGILNKINCWLILRHHGSENAVEWHKVLKEKEASIKNSVSSKTIFQNGRKIKTFLDKQLREFLTTRPILQAMIKAGIKVY